jgi:hypothetical protein
MDNNPSTSPLRKVSLPTFASSLPVEIAALPASTRTSFTRVDNNTRPGTAAGDNDDAGDGTILRDGAPAQVPQPEDESEQVVEAAAVVVPQVPQTLVQFLLVSGRRRSMAFDPETTVGRVKELVWNTWPCGTPTTSFSPSSPSFPFTHTHIHGLALSFLERARAAPVASFLSSLYGGNFVILNADVLLSPGLTIVTRLARRAAACSFLSTHPPFGQDSPG